MVDRVVEDGLVELPHGGLELGLALALLVRLEGRLLGALRGGVDEVVELREVLEDRGDARRVRVEATRVDAAVEAAVVAAHLHVRVLAAMNLEGLQLPGGQRVVHVRPPAVEDLLALAGRRVNEVGTRLAPARAALPLGLARDAVARIEEAGGEGMVRLQALDETDALRVAADRIVRGLGQRVLRGLARLARIRSAAGAGGGEEKSESQRESSLHPGPPCKVPCQRTEPGLAEILRPRRDRLLGA